MKGLVPCDLYKFGNRDETARTENQVSSHEGQARLSKIQTFQMGINFEGGDELKGAKVTEKDQMCPACDRHVFKVEMLGNRELMLRNS